jgi:hypothetical protein
MKPIYFKVDAWLKEPSKEEQEQVKSDCCLLEIMLSDIDKDLMEEPWKLVGWEYSDGIKRSLLSGSKQLGELDIFP